MKDGTPIERTLVSAMATRELHVYAADCEAWTSKPGTVGMRYRRRRAVALAEIERRHTELDA